MDSIVDIIMEEYLAGRYDPRVDTTYDEFFDDEQVETAS